MIDYKCGNLRNAKDMLREALKSAIKAFNMASTLEGWIACTKLKVNGL